VLLNCAECWPRAGHGAGPGLHQARPAFGELAQISKTGQNLLSTGHIEFLDGLQVNATPKRARAFVARTT
jgi:hypothetical protein